MLQRLPLAITVTVKVALVSVLVFGALRQDLSQFHGRAMTGRALTYPIAALIVPAIGLLLRRRGSDGVYRHAGDLALGMTGTVVATGVTVVRLRRGRRG